MGADASPYRQTKRDNEDTSRRLRTRHSHPVYTCANPISENKRLTISTDESAWGCNGGKNPVACCPIETIDTVCASRIDYAGFREGGRVSVDFIQEPPPKFLSVQIEFDPNMVFSATARKIHTDPAVGDAQGLTVP